MDKQQLKQLAVEQIDSRRADIIGLGRAIYSCPETGFREHKAAAKVADALEALGLPVERGMALTGCRARTNRHKDGPRVAVMGELDSVVCSDHPDSDPATGAVHACGHNLQLAVMYGVAVALAGSGVLNELDGGVDFFAVPAEELIELDYREELRQQGKLRFLAGKPELIAQGAFDDVDICMMTHNFPLAEGCKAAAQNTGNGFVTKRVRFVGVQAHAGAAPWEGVNALNMASLAINNINAQRETFREADRVRIHHIITKGGDISNSVPDDVRMEGMVRAASLSAVADAACKFDRSVQGAAIALGGHAIIEDSPGYLPMNPDTGLALLFAENAADFYPPSALLSCMESTASFDIGDLSMLRPVLHAIATGISGGLHSADYRVVDEEDACIIPAKILACMVIDLLYDGAGRAREITESFVPALTKAEYIELLESMERRVEY